LLRTPLTTLIPYTTLFRSAAHETRNRTTFPQAGRWYAQSCLCEGLARPVATPQEDSCHLPSERRDYPVPPSAEGEEWGDHTRGSAQPARTETAAGDSGVAGLRARPP